MRSSPPGPKGLPLVGNSYHYARDPFVFLTACGRTYRNEDVVELELGRQSVYMLLDPAEIARVLVADDDYTKATFEDAALDRLLGEGLLLSEGENWQRQRQLVQPAFGPERIDDYATVMTEHAERLLDNWRVGETRDVRVEMSRLTVEIIADAMFGTKLGAGTVTAIQSALEPIGQRFEPAFRRILIPDWAPTPENVAYREAVETLDRVLDDIVRERRGSEAERDDLLSMLLEAAADPDHPLDGDQLRDELITMLLAGHDTTALALTYTWYLLATHPEVKATLFAELDEVLDGELPTTADVRKLRYADRVLKEAMRLYPPVFTMFRQASRDVTLGGYRIPQGSTVMLPQWIVHRSSRHYDDPETFDPDRWTPERAATRPNYAYFPFGGGPRHCIGKRFATMEATLILATIARDYELELASDSPLELRGSLTMHPKNPVNVTLRER